MGEGGVNSTQNSTNLRLQKLVLWGDDSLRPYKHGLLLQLKGQVLAPGLTNGLSQRLSGGDGVLRGCPGQPLAQHLLEVVLLVGEPCGVHDGPGLRAGHLEVARDVLPFGGGGLNIAEDVV